MKEWAFINNYWKGISRYEEEEKVEGIEKDVGEREIGGKKKKQNDD